MATSWDVAAEFGPPSLEPSQAEAAAGLKERRSRAHKVTTTRKTNAIQQSFQSSEFSEMIQNALQLQFTEHETRMECLVAHKLALLQQHMSMSLQRLESVLISGSSTASCPNKTGKSVKLQGHCDNEDAKAPVHQPEMENVEIPAQRTVPNQSVQEVVKLQTNVVKIKSELGRQIGCGNLSAPASDMATVKRAQTFGMQDTKVPDSFGGNYLATGASSIGPSAAFNLQQSSQTGQEEWLKAEENKLSTTNEAIKKGQLAPEKVGLNNSRKSRRTELMHSMSASWANSVKRLAMRISTHSYFDSFISIVIVLNAGYIGFCTEWRIANAPDAKMPFELKIIDLVFAGIFTIELAIRIVAEGRLFLYGDNWRWNFLDSVIVALAITEELISFAAGSVTTVRLLRMLRLTRIVRGIRLMRFFRDLRLMVAGIISSMKSLLWCIILLVFVKLIFSVTVIEVVADDIHRIKQQTGCSNAGCPDDDEQPPPVLLYWGSVLSSLYSLFKAITGGQDWHQLADPLGETHMILVFFFCMYIAFAVFAVLNIVTGVFVENAAAFAQADSENVILEDINHRQKLIQEVKTVFKAADKDGSGTLDQNEFEDLFNDPVVQAYFRKLQLDIKQSGSQGLFRLMDFEGNGTIDIDTFVMSVSQLRGEAKSLEIAKLRFDLSKIGLRLRHITKILETAFEVNAASKSENPSSMMDLMATNSDIGE